MKRIISRVSAFFKGIPGFVFYMINSASELRIGAYAAQASFFIILSLVPFAMFVLSLVHIVLPYFMQISDADLIRGLNSIFPYRTALMFENIIHDIFDRSAGISLLTALMSVWFSSRGMMSLSQGINNVISRGERQNYFVIRAMSILYVFLFMLLVALSIVVLVFGQGITEILSEKFPALMRSISGIVHSREPIMFVLLTFFFTLFYKFMPKTRWALRELIPGAALAAAAWLLFTRLFSIYVMFAKSYDSIYGSISYIILAMLWLYFCIYILLLCAEFDYWLKCRKMSRSI